MTYTDHAEIVRPQWDLNTLPTLTGKVAIVTGANTSDGVGWHIAHQLALKGAKVYIGARSVPKAKTGITTMLQESPNLDQGNLQPLAIDLSDLEQVKDVAEQFAQTEKRLDILVNNAGLLPGAQQLDQNGVSTHMVVNHFAPMLLTLTLLPLLRATATNKQSDVRIVNVNSTSHVDAPLSSHFRNLDDFNATFPSEGALETYKMYGHTKLAAALFSVELQERLSREDVPILVMYPHPGGIASAGAASFLGGRDNDTFRSSMTPFQGALTPLWCAVSPEVRHAETEWKGQFVMPFGGVKIGNPRVKDESLCKECWETSETIIKDILNK